MAQPWVSQMAGEIWSGMWAPLDEKHAVLVVSVDIFLFWDFAFTRLDFSKEGPVIFSGQTV